MVDVINYDQDVENLIEELYATGHYTDRDFRKEFVVFHHNAQAVGHDGVLKTWQTRRASAHFNVDQNGTVAQFVEVQKYAWSNGHTDANMRGISIEMTNESVGGDWPVGEDTWKSAARLAGWIHAKIFGKAPTRNSVRYHQDFKATACPGPYMVRQYDKLLAEVVAAYEYFTKPKPPESPPVATPVVDRKPNSRPWIVKKHQRLLEIEQTGRWGPVTDARAILMRNAARAKAGWPVNVERDFDIETVQDVINTEIDGIWGPMSQAALENWIKAFQHHVGVSQDGIWGPNTDSKWILARKRHFMNY